MYVCRESYCTLMSEIGSTQSTKRIPILPLQEDKLSPPWSPMDIATGESTLAPDMHVPVIFCGMLVVQCVLV